jgi:hypothetical protein
MSVQIDSGYPGYLVVTWTEGLPARMIGKDRIRPDC